MRYHSTPTVQEDQWLSYCNDVTKVNFTLTTYTDVQSKDQHAMQKLLRLSQNKQGTAQDYMWLKVSAVRDL